MIQITPHMRILVAVDPIDFRTGIDGIVSLMSAKTASRPLCRRDVRFLQSPPHSHPGAGI